MKEMGWAEHFGELRRRIVISFGFFLCTLAVCYFFSDRIYSFLIDPLSETVQDFPGLSDNFSLIYTDLTEVFFVYLRVSILASIFISTPFFIWQLYGFLAPGLYAREKAMILPYLIASPTLFAAGGGIVYYYIFPLAWKFFIGYGTQDIGSIKVEFMPSVSEYLNLVVQLTLAFGIAFQLPIILTFLVHINVMTASFLIQKRKFAIVLIFIVAAILTPPDVLSQIGLAIPMLFLYESSIFACKYVEKTRKQNPNS